MALSITVDTTGLQALAKQSSALAKQLPFAVSLALNGSAKGSRSIPGSDAYNVVKALAGASRGYFDQPTPFIEKAWRATNANKANPEVTIYPEDKRVKYLKAHITGGARTYKGYEAKLLGLSNESVQALIPSFVKRNQAGNATRGTLGKIIQASAAKGPGSVLVGKPRGGNRPVGVYERTKQGSLKPLFVAQPTAIYRGGFPLSQTTATVINRRFSSYLEAALEQALKSAR
jgi:hypothetical protein